MRQISLLSCCRAVVVGSALLALANLASAQIVYFTAQWSGSPENSATATAMIGIDVNTADLSGAINYSGSLSAFGVTSLTLTISGASSGNGTFTEGQFTSMTWVNTSQLDFDTELVGQPNGSGTWGVSSGDFNIFGDAPLPNGGGPFGLTTNGGSGDNLYLTSFAPVPEPASAGLLFGLGAVATCVVVRRRKANRA